VSDATVHTAGLSGDHGWNEADDRPMGGISTALLLTATTLYWGSLWLLAGVPPISTVVSRRWRNDKA
jgi:hypothetical protein